jgi:hypothetical protein
MGIFRKFRTVPVPNECQGMEIRIESSVCTGEKTIGFFNPDTRRLMYTELVKSDDDISAFYEKYGLKRD